MHWNVSASLLVEKSPPDLLRTRFLAAVFSPAWFAVIVRHPLAVCKRVAPPAARLACARNWLLGYEGALGDVAAGGLDASVTFYELWAAAPVAEMERLSAAARLPFAPANASRPPGAFCWADVIDEGARVNLGEHSIHGWGYAGPKAADGLPDVRGDKIAVDGSRLLPEPGADARREPLRDGYAALETRVNAFGYSFYVPFVTGCVLELRSIMACPARGDDPPVL